MKDSKAAVRRRPSKWVFKKIRNIQKTTPVLESLFNKVAGLKVKRPATLLKRGSNTCVSLLILRNF